MALGRQQLWGREGGAEEWVGTQDGAELGSGGDTRHTVPRECGCVGPGAQSSPAPLLRALPVLPLKQLPRTLCVRPGRQ